MRKLDKEKQKLKEQVYRHKAVLQHRRVSTVIPSFLLDVSSLYFGASGPWFRLGSSSTIPMGIRRKLGFFLAPCIMIMCVVLRCVSFALVPLLYRTWVTSTTNLPSHLHHTTCPARRCRSLITRTVVRIHRKGFATFSRRTRACVVTWIQGLWRRPKSRCGRRSALIASVSAPKWSGLWR